MTKTAVREHRLALALAVRDHPRLYFFHPLAWSRVGGRLISTDPVLSEKKCHDLSKERIKTLLTMCQITPVAHSDTFVRLYHVDHKIIYLWWVETVTVQGVSDQLIGETWLPRRDERCATLISVMEQIASGALGAEGLLYKKSGQK